MSSNTDSIAAQLGERAKPFNGNMKTNT